MYKINKKYIVLCCIILYIFLIHVSLEKRIDVFIYEENILHSIQQYGKVLLHTCDCNSTREVIVAIL